jgi:hypothetical protein
MSGRLCNEVEDRRISEPGRSRGELAQLPQPSLIVGPDFEEMRKDHEDKCTKALASRLMPSCLCAVDTAEGWATDPAGEET